MLRDQFTMSGQSAGGGGEQFEAEVAAGRVAEAIGGYSAELYGNSFEAERARMQAAQFALPGFEELAGNLTGQRAGQYGLAGAMDREIAEAYMGLPGRVAADPYNRLDAYQGIILGMPGGMGETTVPTSGGNALVGGLGGAATGAGIGFMIGGPPGAAVGGVLGGGAGLMFT